jgi:hypothetical protein
VAGKFPTNNQRNPPLKAATGFEPGPEGSTNAADEMIAARLSKPI